MTPLINGQGDSVREGVLLVQAHTVRRDLADSEACVTMPPVNANRVLLVGDLVGLCGLRTAQGNPGQLD